MDGSLLRAVTARLDVDLGSGKHPGSGAGFFNLIRIYPTRRVGIAIMGNATKYHIDAVARLALAG